MNGGCLTGSATIRGASRNEGSAPSTTVRLQNCLVRLRAEDPAARTELIASAERRLHLLAQQMFRRCPKLYSREQSDDLFQEAMIRLWKALESVGPTTVAGFMGLAALQIRRSLCDLVRRHFGKGRTVDLPCDCAGSRVPGQRGETALTDDTRNGPEELATWSEFHLAADSLSEPYRTTFDLLFYHGLSQGEVAQLMQVSPRQVQRYWHAARLKLSKVMDGSWPIL